MSISDGRRNSGGGLFRDPQFLEKLNGLFCCTARLANDVQTIIAGTSHHKNGCTSQSFCGPPFVWSLPRTRSDVQTTRSQSRTLIWCQDPQCHGFAVRGSEGCFSVGHWKGGYPHGGNGCFVQSEW